MSLFRKYCLSVLVFGLVAVLPRGSLADQTNEVTTPPACVNNLGETILFSLQSGSQGDVAAGMANRDTDGRPVIFRMNYENATPAFQRFIDYHECAHHQVGHVDQPHPPRNSYAHLMNESIADCIAILRVREEADDSYDAIIDGLVDAMTRVGFPKVSTDSRLRNIENCYSNYGSSAEFIAGVLNGERTK